MPMDNAANVIVSRFGNGTFESSTPSVPSENGIEQRDFERYDEKVNQLLEHIEKQEQFNLELLDRLDQQQKHIEERLNSQEKRLNKRDETLMQHLRETMETQKLIAAAQEEEKKKGFWARLFGK